MTPSFKSGFAEDITAMMKWRGTIGYSESCYCYELSLFDHYCWKMYPDATVLTWEIIISYLNTLKCQRDIRVDVAALRNLGKFQLRKGMNACVFPAGFFSYKKNRLPYMMSDDELKKFFEAADNYPYTGISPLLTYTVAVIFRLQYSTGMRPREVRHLTRHDFNYKSDTIYIADSKMHKDRRIVVDHKIMQMCMKYDALARTIYPSTEIFFPNHYQKEFSNSSLQSLFKKCWTIAGNPLVSSKTHFCSPYILRHNYATRKIMLWAEEGKKFEEYMPYLSAYLGHATFRETCYYLHLLPERISKMGCLDISKILKEASYEE